MSNLPQQYTLIQYISDGETLKYDFRFLILKPEDIKVYVTLKKAIPDPENDIKNLDDDYTVINVGNINGGTIVFKDASIIPSNSIISLNREMENSIETEFANSRNFNGKNLDDCFERLILIVQQLATTMRYKALQYIPNSYSKTTGNNQLPVLTDKDGYGWVSQGGQVIAAKIGSGPDADVLRSELESQAPKGSDGASLVGFYDDSTKKGSKLDAALNALINRVEKLEGATIQLEESALHSGDIIYTSWGNIRPGFLFCNGESLLINEYPKLYSVIGKTFGSTDDVHFNIPDLRRRVAVGSGGIGSYILGAGLGNIGGEETHTQTVAEMPPHNHVTFAWGRDSNSVNRSSGNAIPMSELNETQYSGSGMPFNILQPSLILNAYIKT
ncbi:MAG: hypothetical protein RJA83_650 [Pseudomonadota bacterium]